MMNGAEYFIAGALGAFFGALVFYLMGKKAGKNEEEGKEKDKILENIAVSCRIDNLSDDDVKRMPSKYD